MEIIWIAGHAGVAANHQADHEDKEAATNTSWDCNISQETVVLAEIKSLIYS